MPILLELLKAFPEEAQSKHLRIGENRRRAVNAELSQQTSSVLNFLSNICASNSQNTAVIKKALQCLSSWLSNPLVYTDELASSPFFISICALLQTENSPAELHDAACECIVSALYRSEDVTAHKKLALSLQTACYGMMGAFQIAVATEDCDRLQNYARIICEMNESFLECMVRYPGQELGDFRTLDMLLMLAGYHDYSLIEMTFNIWYRLSEYLFNRNDDALNMKFVPYIERYIMALYKHCRFDTDYEGLPDESDDFVEFRHNVSDTIKDVVFIIGSDHCVEMMFSVIRSVSSGTWDETEAALYIISTIIHNVIPSGKKFTPLLLQSILNLPDTSHPTLIFTSIRIMGSAAEWLEECVEYRDVSISWLLLKITNVNFSKVAAKALENICAKFEFQLIKYFDQILAVIPILETSTTKGQHMETAILSLITACSSILNGAPAEETVIRLGQLTLPQAERLTALVDTLDAKVDNYTVSNENAANSWNRLSQDPVLWIDRIAAVFRILRPWSNSANNPQNGNSNGAVNEANIPWLDVANEIWPILSKVFSKYEKSVRIIEHCCRAIRFVIRSLGVQSIGFVEQLVQQMVFIYERYQHSCFLYLASILVDEYAHLHHLNNGLIYMLNILSRGSFDLLLQPNGFRDHPDTIDDLYRLAIRFIQRLPSVFFQESVSDNLFECGIVGLNVDHVEASRSLTKFFTECIESLLAARKTNYRDAGVDGVENLIKKYGKRLVSSTLQSALFAVNGSLKRDMADLLYLIGRISKEKQSEWLKCALDELPHDSGLTATSEQLQLFLQNVIEAKDVHDVYHQIRDLIQLYS